VHVSIWDVPDTDKNGESGQTDNGSRSSQGPRHTWSSSLWLWPAAAIALAGIAGWLFGTTGALLVGGEALAVLVVTASILTVSRNRGSAIGIAALVAVGAVFAGLAWAPALHHASKSSSPATTRSATLGRPLDWQWRTISQHMAQGANFRGADLDNANLDGLQLRHRNFDGVQADGANFRGSQLEDASFRGASLKGACLQGANLMGADLTGANFTGADVAGVTVSAKAKKAALVWPSPQAGPVAACG
jgi:hypothetical protein